MTTHVPVGRSVYTHWLNARGGIEADVGVIRLTDVDEISAVGTAVSGSGFKVGDVVKTITQ